MLMKDEQTQLGNGRHGVEIQPQLKSLVNTWIAVASRWTGDKDRAQANQVLPLEGKGKVAIKSRLTTISPTRLYSSHKVPSSKASTIISVCSWQRCGDFLSRLSGGEVHLGIQNESFSKARIEYMIL
jgi:hypothetical protein